MRIIVFSMLPSVGLSNAAAALVGQNLGAQKPARAERAAWVTAFANMVFLGIIGLFLIIFPKPLITIFINEPEVVSKGVVSLRLIALGLLFYAFGLVIVQALNGAGDTAAPMKINIFCYWLVEIPLAWFLAIPLGMKEKGVYAAIIIAESMTSIMGVIVFRRGRWKKKQV
jgi:Na+-driven multidrug efflux pump